MDNSLVAGHDVQQFHEAEAGGSYPEGHHGAFFRLVLFDGIFVEMVEAEFDEGPVLFEELRDVEILPAFIGLLIEIDGPDPVLIVFDIGGDIDDEVIGAHVAQQTDKAAFVEFDELFGEPDLVGLRIVYEIL